MPSRREFLKMSAVAGGSLLLPYPALAGAARVEPFSVPLAIPPVIKPVRSDGDRDYYVTTMRTAVREIVPGKRTTIWGFDGRFPGPTFKVRSGREIVVRRRNRLRVPVSIHLHGGKVPAKSDGHPLDVIRPGESKDYVYPNDQEAATLWYHDHTHHHTSRNNYMGLSGLYVIGDDAEEELNLPKGKHDVPLVIQDRTFRRDGSLKFVDDHDEVLGKRLLVNGRPTPYFEVANVRYRFRILNGSHTRGYNLALDTGEPLVQIASDQGLLSAPSPAATISLWPSERAEVVIDFSAYATGTSVTLVDLVDPMDPSSAVPLVRFDVTREEEDTSSLPGMLRPVMRLLPGTTQREFVLSQDPETHQWLINGKPFDPDRIDFKPKLGETETWSFRNASSVTHPMHVHLVRFQILDRSNTVLAPGELGWKDTVRVDPSATVRIVVPFEGFTGRYMLHCHNLAHEDHSMMGQMRVVA